MKFEDMINTIQLGSCYELIKDLQEAQRIYEQNENLFIMSPKELIELVIEYGHLKNTLEKGKKELENENTK